MNIYTNIVCFAQQIGLLNEIPSIGPGIDFTKRSVSNPSKSLAVGGGGGDKASMAFDKANVVDLSKVLFQSLDDSLLHASSAGNQTSSSFLDESFTSLSFQQQKEGETTISELFALNADERLGDNQISELWNTNSKRKSESGTSSAGSSPSIDELLAAKRKVKKYAIEADAKLVKNFDEIKSKLAHSVRSRTHPSRIQMIFDICFLISFENNLVGV